MSEEEITIRDRERGMALISVLWGVAILSVIATIAMAASLTYRRIEANAWQGVRSRTIAEAAVVRAVLALIDTRPEERWRVDGVPQEFLFDGVKITISIQDELGKVDLNMAREDILRNMFHATVRNQGVADGLTDRVLDWRSPGELKRINGATPSDYKAAGYPYAPRSGPFQSVDELRLVMEMTPALFGTIEPVVTIYSRRPTIDPQTAPKLALIAALGGDEQAADAAISARDAGASGRTRPGTLDPGMGLGGRAFTIDVKVALDTHTYAHQAVIRLTGDPARPYWILAWNTVPSLSKRL